MIKMLNLENLFNLFSPENVKSDPKTYLDFENQPLYYCGMWKKLILNHLNFSKKVANFFASSNGEFDIEDIREAGKFVAFNRAWFYINKLDLNNDDHILTILSYSNDEFIATLEMGIKHYTTSEEYEKCVKLLKIKNISRKS